MMKRWIWIGSILMAAVLYLFENNAGTLTVLVGVLAVPAFGLLPLAGKRVDLNVSLNATQEKGITGTLTVTNLDWLPKPRLRMTVSCRNLRTGEEKQSIVERSLLPKQRIQIEFAVDCPYCGKVEVETVDVMLADVFDLFACRLSCKAKGEFTIVPQLFEPAISLESHGMAMPDSDTYSPTKPGSDPGETFAVREYVPGDAVRRIHWKLSEKTDRLMVREFGLPVVDEAALLLETAGAQSPDEVDAITEVFASISAVLRNADICHHVFWRDSKTNELRDFHITSEDEFTFMLEQLLELPPREDGSVAQQFTQRFAHCPYAHVIVVGGQIPQGVRDLYNGNRVSVLLPHRDSIPEGMQPDGTYVFSFTPHGYCLELCRLEV